VVSNPLPELTLEACRARYLRNLEALYASDGELAHAVEAVPFASCPPLEPSTDGRVTARVAADDGQRIYLHSRRSPADEAARLVGGPRGRAVADAGEGDATIVLLGVGLGYAVTAALQSPGRPLVVAVEPDLALLKTAMCVCDFAEALKARRLLFLAGPTAREWLGPKLEPRHTWLMLGTRLVALPHSLRCHSAEFLRIRTALLDLIAYLRTQTVTLLKNAQVTFENIAFNLPEYLGSPGVEVLAGRGRGMPAIVVGAGPSLSRQLARLREVQDRAIIVAVQTVLKPLLAAGIAPHFVVSLDYHEISQHFFDGVDGARTVLVAEPKVTWRVPEQFRGRKHLLHSDVVDELLPKTAPRRAALRAGSTVAHLAFYLAEHLGCDPILLLGLDLAFTDGLYYAPGMPVEAIWDVELGRFQTIEMKQWERIARMRPLLRTVEDIHGQPIHTDEPFFTYIHQFETDLARSPARVVHIGERGARLGPIEAMPAEEALRQFCRDPLPAQIHSPDESARGALDLRPNLDELREQVREVEAVRDLAKKTCDVLAQMSGLLQQPAKFNQLVAEVDQHRLEMRNHERVYRLIVRVSQTAELRRIRTDRGFDEDPGSTEDEATTARRLKRDQQFVSEFLEGAEFVLRTLRTALTRLEAAAGASASGGGA
jgi:hypothetical protein